MRNHTNTVFFGHTWRSGGRQGLVNLTCPTMTAALWSFGGPGGDGDISFAGWARKSAVFVSVHTQCKLDNGSFAEIHPGMDTIG